MSLYAVMEPVVEYGNTSWVRRGARTKCLGLAKDRAEELQGRVIDLESYQCIADFWVEPEPEVKLAGAEYRQARAIASLFH